MSQQIRLVGRALVIAISVSPAMTYAQDSERPNPATKVEQFLLSKGTLVFKHSYKIGSLAVTSGSVELDAVMLVDAQNETIRLKGLRVEVTAPSLNRSHTSFLDLEEVESLAKSLAFMGDALQKWTTNPPADSLGRLGMPIPAPSRELAFSTKGDFQIALLQDNRQVGGLVASGVIGRTSAVIGVKDIMTIQLLVDRALVVLNAL